MKLMNKLAIILFLTLCSVALVGSWLTAYNIGTESGYKDGYKIGKLSVSKDSQYFKPYDGFKVKGNKVQTIIDTDTGCMYAIFDQKAITPVYTSGGNVAGCGNLNN